MKKLRGDNHGPGQLQPLACVQFLEQEKDVILCHHLTRPEEFHTLTVLSLYRC